MSEQRKDYMGYEPNTKEISMDKCRLYWMDVSLFLDLIGNLLAVPIGTLGRLQEDPAHFYSAVWTCSTAYILSKDATLMGP